MCSIPGDRYAEQQLADKEIQIASLKRTVALREETIKRRDWELACYRAKYPGWVFSPTAGCLYCNGEDWE